MFDGLNERTEQETQKAKWKAPEKKLGSEVHRASGGEGPELAATATLQIWPVSGHMLADGLLTDPVIGGVTAHVIPLLLNMDTVFRLPVPVLPVVWLISAPKPGNKRALFCQTKIVSLPPLWHKELK